MSGLWCSSPLTISRTRTTCLRSLLVVAPLCRGDLAVHVVERRAAAHEHAGNGEQPIGAKAFIQPLTREQKNDDRKGELDPEASEIGAGQTLFGARLRPFPVFHFWE